MTIHQQVRLEKAVKDAEEIIVTTRSRCDEALITQEIENAKYVTINKGILIDLLEGIRQLEKEVALSEKTLEEEGLTQQR
tara:strand:- start:128 stop:367 length:240 start_codon:yes stop_codon:yes gene_type:complete